MVHQIDPPNIAEHAPTVIPDAAISINQARDQNNPEPEGVWVFYAYDVRADPQYLGKDEIDALRYMAKQGYGHVWFWEFGTEWNPK